MAEADERSTSYFLKEIHSYLSDESSTLSQNQRDRLLFGMILDIQEQLSRLNTKVRHYEEVEKGVALLKAKSLGWWLGEKPRRGALFLAIIILVLTFFLLHLFGTEIPGITSLLLQLLGSQ